MDRIIKFRAWDGAKMHLPEYSDHDDFMVDAEGNLVYTKEVGYERHTHIYRRAGWMLMQYTGLQDKNGKDIYEGDILAKSPDAQSRYIVYFNKSKLSFTSRFEVLDIDDEEKEYWKVRYDDHSIAGALTYDNMVVGNIHENPDLQQ